MQGTGTAPAPRLPQAGREGHVTPKSGDGLEGSAESASHSGAGWAVKEILSQTQTV